MLRPLDDSGTIGAIPYAIVTLVIFGMALITMGPVIDEIIEVDNAIMQDGLIPYSQQRYDTMNFLLMCWKALSFVATLVVVIFLLMNGAQSRTGGI